MAIHRNDARGGEARGAAVSWNLKVGDKVVRITCVLCMLGKRQTDCPNGR